MEFLFILLVLFVLGTLVTYFLQVGKNIAYIMFVMVLGWGVWQVAGPSILNGPGTPVENFVAFNKSFSSTVSDDIDWLLFDSNELRQGRDKIDIVIHLAAAVVL